MVVHVKTPTNKSVLWLFWIAVIVTDVGVGSVSLELSNVNIFEFEDIESDTALTPWSPGNPSTPSNPDVGVIVDVGDILCTPKFVL